MHDLSPWIPAILADGYSDFTRLACADYLAERGDVRGEFIRVQCELAKRPYDVDDSRRFANVWDRFVAGKPIRLKADTTPMLMVRQRHLLLAHGAQWVSPHTLITSQRYRALAIRTAQGVTMEFERGFVSQITCTARDWLRHADELTRQQPILRVALTTWPEGTDFHPDYRPRTYSAGTVDWLRQRWFGIEFVQPAERLHFEYARRGGTQHLIEQVRRGEISVREAVSRLAVGR